MFIQILLHADPIVVFMQFGHLLRYRQVRISLSELADHWCSKFESDIQGRFGESFGALRLALDPHDVVWVDHQVLVQSFKPESG